MILAHATRDDGGTMLILGLSRGNIDRLQAGQPMRLTRETHGDGIPEGWTIAILFGETEQAIADDLARLGALGPDTEIKTEPRLAP